MKKKLIYSSVLTALLSACSIAWAGGPEIIPEPDYFSGFYVGGIGGVHHTTFTGNSEIFRDQPFSILFIPILPVGVVQSNTPRGGNYTGFGGVQGGFGKAFRQFYVGLQGWGEWGNSSVTDTRNAQVPFSPVIVDLGTPTAFVPIVNATTSTTMKIKNDYGVAGKFGWIVAPRSMFYGKVGASWANLSVDSSVNAQANLSVIQPVGTVFTITNLASGYSSSGQQSKLGLLLGVGFEQFVYQDLVSINVEGNYVNYGHVSTHANQGQVSTNTIVTLPTVLPGASYGFGPFLTNTFTSASASAQVSSLMAGLNFYFGRNWLF